MGHAQRDDDWETATFASGRATVVLEDRVVSDILESPFRGADGDPITGIRNAFVGSAIFWAILGLVFLVLR
jgi:hypothetical protein